MYELLVNVSHSEDESKHYLSVRLGHPAQCLGEVLLHLLARNDCVKEAVFEQKLRPLKALGELLADGLLDDARTSEADQGFGFCDVEIAQHGEARGNAAGGGVGHHGDV